MKNLVVLFLALVGFVLGGCTSKQALKQALESNPELIFDVLEKNPDKLEKALVNMQMGGRERARKAEAEEREKELSNPKQPLISEERAMRGPADAPITLVEYSDFQCPYCQQGYLTVKAIEEKYGNKVRLVYKHLPLPMHPAAIPAAKWFEAIALQDKKKAYDFHDQVFTNQQELGKNSDKFLAAMAKKVGVDMAKVKADLNNPKVTERIKADSEEASKFGFRGTPGFLVNGVSFKGAMPAEEFYAIIDKILATK